MQRTARSALSVRRWEDINKRMGRLTDKAPLGRGVWALLLPGLHLVACVVTMSGLFIPKLQYLAIGWSFIMVADIPVSLVAYAVGWKHSSLAFTWIVLVGTMWWYLLGRVVQRILRKSKTGD